MSETPSPYNPLDRVELGKSVERALLAQPLCPLPPTDRFPGAGLYTIYYVGAFLAYAPIAPPQRVEGEVPIYVGRARPKGSRQGIVEGLDVTTPDPVLFLRLQEHMKSIKNVEEYAAATSTQNLRVEDFRCRYLVADDIWVPLGEALLIGHYRPVWNVVVDGFGNHAPGSGRGAQARSPWDELHPGRAWAARLPAPKLPSELITREVQTHLAHLELPDLDVRPSLDAGVRAALQQEAANDADG